MNKQPAATLLSIVLVTASFAGVFAIAGVQVASAGHGSGKVIVDEDGGAGVNKTIQAGVNHANSGDTVVVRAGTYNETVIVNKSVNIIAEDGAVLNGSTLSNPTAAFNITNYQANITDTAIRGFEIENYDTGVTIHGTDFTSGLDMYNVTLLNNSFDVSGGAIEVHHESGQFELVTISNNTVSNAASGVSVFVNGSVEARTENVTVLDNSFTGVSGVATSFWTQNSARLTDVNLLANNGSTATAGLEVSVSDEASIRDFNASANDFSNTDTPIQITSGGGTDPTISEVDVLLNALNESTKAGLAIESPSSNLSISTLNVSANDFEGSGAGIAIDVGSSSSITDLNVSRNALNKTGGAGLNLTVRGTASVDGVTLFENNVSDNTFGVVVNSLGVSSVVSDLNVSTNALVDNGDKSTLTHEGSLLLDSRNGTIRNVTITNNALNGSDVGITVESGTSGLVENVTIRENAIRDTTEGIFIEPGNGTVRDFALTKNDLTGSGVGLEIETANMATVADVTLQENDLRNTDYGILFDPRHNSTIRDFNATNNLLNESNALASVSTPTIYVDAVDGTTVRNVTFLENVIGGQRNGGSTVKVSALGTSVVRNLTLRRNDVRNSTNAVVFNTSHSAAIEDVNVTTNSMTNATGDAIYINASGGVVSNVTVLENALNETDEDGLDIQATGSGTVRDVRIDTNSLEENADMGIEATTSGSGTISRLNITNNFVRGSGDDALFVEAIDGTIANVTVLKNALNESSDDGIDIEAEGTGVVRDLTVDTNDLTSGGDEGIDLAAYEDANVSDVYVTTNLVRNNSGDAFDLLADNGTVSNVTLFENGLNGSGSDGVFVTGRGTGTVSDLLVERNNVSRNGDDGIDVEASDSSTVTSLNVTSNLAVSSSGDALDLTATDGTISNVTVLKNALNESGDSGLELKTSGTGTITDVSLDTNDLQNNSVGIFVNALGSSRIANLSVDQALTSGASVAGASIVAETSGVVHNVTFTESGLNDTSGTGLQLVARDTGAVTNVSFDTVDAGNNARGALLLANESGRIANVSATSALFADNANVAVELQTGVPGVASDATIEHVTFAESGLNDTASGPGLLVESFDGSTVTDLNLTTVDASNNSAGLDVTAYDQSTVSAIHAEGVLFGESSGDAGSLVARDNATITGVNVTSAGFNESGGTGLVLSAHESGAVTDVSLETVIANNNSAGALLFANESGRIANVSTETALFGENSNGAVELQAGVSGASSAATISNVSFTEAGLNDTSGTGLLIEGYGTSNVTDVSLDTVDASNNSVGLDVTAHEQSTISGLHTDGVLFGESSGDAGSLVARDGATITEVNFTSTGFNESSGTGLVLRAESTGSITDVSLGTVIANNNTAGLQVYANDSTRIANLSAETALLGENAGDAVVLRAGTDANADATISNVSFTEAGLNETGGTGLLIESSGTSNVTDVSLDTVDASTNTRGIVVHANDDSTIAGVSASSVLFGNSSSTAGLLSAGDGQGSAATIENVSFDTVGFNQTGDETGLLIEANGSSEVDGVSLETVIANNNSAGLRVYANDSSRIANLSTDTVLLGENTGNAASLFAAPAGGSAVIENVSFVSTGLNESGGTGLVIAADGTGLVRDVSLDTVDASDNAQGALVFANGSAAIRDIDVNSVLFAENQRRAVELRTGVEAATTDATIENVSFDTVGLNETVSGAGLRVESWGSSSITDVSLETVDASNNTAGLRLLANEDSRIANVSTQTVLFANSSQRATRLRAGRPGQGGSAIIANVSFVENGLNESGGSGLRVGAYGTSTVTNVSIETADVTDNTNGIRVEAREDSRVANLSVDTALFSGSAENAVFLNASGTATLEGVDLASVGVNQTDGTGLRVQSWGQATVTDLSLDTVEASDNAEAGVAFHAYNDSSIAEVRFDTVRAQNNTVGSRFVSHDGATIRDVFLTNTLQPDNDQAALVLAAGDADSNDAALLEDVRLETNGLNQTRNGPGLTVLSRGDSTVRNVTVFQNLFTGSETGLRIGAQDSALMEDVLIRQAIVNDTTTGVLFDGEPGGTHESVRIVESLIQDNDVGISVAPSTPTEGLRLRLSFLANNTRGIVNHNPDGIFDARNVWWGDSSGPSTPAGASVSALADPVTGKLANGEGDTVSEDPDDPGVSNVRFDPAIGGKTRCSEDGQLIDPVPDQSFSVNVSGQEISGSISDFVGLCIWERAVLPFTTDHRDAATKVRNAQIFLETSSGDIQVTGQGSNREYLKVFTSDQEMSLDFEKVTGADTTRFANEQVQLLVFRANETRDLQNSFTTSQNINATTGEVNFGTNAVSIDVRDLGTLDANGQKMDIPFTPAKPGEYLLAIATVESGDGFEESNDTLSFNVLNDSTIIAGTTLVNVQERNSTVTPNKAGVQPGNTVTFDARSNLASTNVSHAVLLYEKEDFEDKIIEVKATTETVDGNILINVTGTSDGQSFLLSVNATQGGTVNNITTSGSLDGVDSVSKAVLFADSREDIKLTPGDGFAEGTYQWVHLAVATNNVTSRSTDEGTIQIAERFPDITLSTTGLNFGTVPTDNAVTKQVTITNDGNDTLSISSTSIAGANPGQFAIASGGGSQTLSPGESATIEVQFAPTSGGAKSARLEIASDDPDESPAIVSLSGTGAVPDISLPRTAIQFGSVQIDQTATRSVTIENVGGDTLSISSTSIIGTNPGQFAIASGGGSRTIAPGSSATIRVRFAPTSGGAKSARLEIASNDPDESTVTVRLSGSGSGAPPAPAPEPPEVSINRTAPGNVSVTLRNLQPGAVVNVTLPDGVGATDDVLLDGLDVGLGDTVPGSFSLNIDSRRKRPRNRPPLDVVGTVPRYFEITPQGISDAQIRSVQFRFRVAASRLGDSPPSAVTLYRFHDGEWRPLDTQFRKRVGDFFAFRATSPGLSTFAVAIAQPRFEITDPALSPTRVTVGETATASATITNTGGTEGTFTAGLTANKELLATRTVTLAPNESAEVSFEVSFDEPGTYDLAINDTFVGTLTVEPATPTPTPTTPTPTPTPTPTTPTATATPTPEEPKRGVPGLLIALIVVLLLVIVGAAIYFREEIQARLDGFLGERGE